MVLFLYDNGLRHKRVKFKTEACFKHYMNTLVQILKKTRRSEY